MRETSGHPRATSTISKSDLAAPQSGQLQSSGMSSHRVLEHYNGDITRVNIDPRRREKILARYGAGADA